MGTGTMDRIAKWFNTNMNIYDYEAVVSDGCIKISDLEDKFNEPRYYKNDVTEIVSDYYDLLFENLPVEKWNTLKELENNLTQLALDITDGKIEDNNDMILGVCAGLARLGELRTITEYNEYWK